MQKRFIVLFLLHSIQLSNIVTSDKPKKKTHNPYAVSSNHQQGASEKTLHGNEVSLSSSGYNDQNGNTYSCQRKLSYAQQYANYLLGQSGLASVTNSQMQKYQENDDDYQQYNDNFYQGSYNQQANILNNVSNQQVLTFNYQRNQSSLPSYDQFHDSYQLSLDSKNSVNDKLSTSFFHCKTVESVKHFIEQIPVEELDSPIYNNMESIGHILLRKRDRENFKIWLKKGASCTAISGNQEEDPRFNSVTILHLLCIKGLDEFPDLLDLIKEVLERNPSLLSIENGAKNLPGHLILTNDKINDDVTLKILDEFSKYLDLSKSIYVPNKNHRVNLAKKKPRSMDYISPRILKFPKDREERRDFISKLAPEDLDKSFFFNKTSIGQILLIDNDIELFEAWLDRGALCTSVQSKDLNNVYSEDTVLSFLCIKALDKVPNLVDLIKKVLDRNPRLLFHLRNDKHSVANQILMNKNIDDETTLKILKEFTLRGFNFIVDPIIYGKYRKKNYKDMENYKLESIKYIESCIEAIFQDAQRANS